jgi:hypothetical protein
MSDLPFELYYGHKGTLRRLWKKSGLIMDNFEEIYNKYIYATHCELCNKKFEKRIDRQMEHNHETGEFRNIVCNRCNTLKADKKIQCNNTSGYNGISKRLDKTIKQGYSWVFRASVNGKHKHIKQSINLEELIEFAEKWKKDNNYHK